MVRHKTKQECNIYFVASSSLSTTSTTVTYVKQYGWGNGIFVIEVSVKLKDKKVNFLWTLNLKDINTVLYEWRIKKVVYRIYEHNESSGLYVGIYLQNVPCWYESVTILL